MPLFRSTILSLALGLTLVPPAAAADAPLGNGLAGAYLAARHASYYSDYRAAADYYNRTLARDPGNPGLQENLVMAFVGLGDVDSAVPIAQQMREQNTLSQMSNMVVMVDMLANERYGKVIEGLAEDLSVGPLVDGLVASWSLMGEGEAEAAMASFDAAAENTGLSAFAMYHKALALALAGDFEAAEAIFSGEAGGPLPLTRRGAMAHAQVLSQLGRHEAALELIELGWGNDLDPGLEELVTRLKGGETIPFTQVRSIRDGLAEVFYTVAGALNSEASDTSSRKWRSPISPPPMRACTAT